MMRRWAKVVLWVAGTPIVLFFGSAFVVATYQTFTENEQGRDGRPNPSLAQPRVTGPNGLPVVRLTGEALVCMTPERLLDAAQEIARGSKVWRKVYPDCGTLPRGTDVEYNWEGLGFKSGLHGYSGITMTAPDRSSVVKGYVHTRMLDREPRADEYK